MMPWGKVWTDSILDNLSWRCFIENDYDSRNKSKTRRTSFECYSAGDCKMEFGRLGENKYSRGQSQVLSLILSNKEGTLSLIWGWFWDSSGFDNTWGRKIIFPHGGPRRPTHSLYCHLKQSTTSTVSRKGEKTAATISRWLSNEGY